MRLDLLGPLLEELKIGKPYNLFRESGPDKSKRAWYITLRLVFTFALASASLQFEQESLHPELNFTLWTPCPASLVHLVEAAV